MTTRDGILETAARIIERGWNQTTPFLWKLQTEEDWERLYTLNAPEKKSHL